MFGFVDTAIRMSHYLVMSMFTDIHVRFEIMELKYLILNLKIFLTYTIYNFEQLKHIYL